MEEYLNTWKNDKINWKFNKKMQHSIETNVFKKSSIDKKTFKLACKYLKESKGSIRKRLIDTANSNLEKGKKRKRSKKILKLLNREESHE